MSSILKVDQIQLSNGNTPTAKELGVNISGNVVQHAFSNTLVNSSASGSSYVTAVQFSFTPKYNNSSLLIIGTLRWQEAANSYGAQFRIRDITNSTTLQEISNYATYADAATNVIDTECVQGFVASTNNTTARTYALQVANFGSASVSFNPNTSNTTAISILEIAG